MSKRIIVLAVVLIALAGGLWFVVDRLVAPPGAGQRVPPEVAMRFQKHLRAGLELGRLYQITRAAKEFEACARLAPEHAEARFHLGRIFLARRERDSALREFEEALRLAPEHTGIHRFLYEIRSDFPGLADPEKARLRRPRR